MRNYPGGGAFWTELREISKSKTQNVSGPQNQLLLDGLEIVVFNAAN